MSQDKVLEGLKRYKEAYDADYEQRDLGIEDLIFTYDEDGQWDEIAIARRRNKPRYTINKIAAAVNEIIGNYRQNRIEMKARPMQDQSKDEANTYNGLIRAITSNGDAEMAKDHAFKGITVSGFGAIRVLNEFTDLNPFEQDVCIKPIWEALETVWFDPFAKDPTGKDGRYVFEICNVAKEVFKEMYPDAQLTEFPDSGSRSLQAGWGVGNTNDDIRIADYYVKEPVKTGKVLLSDGSIMKADDFEKVADELAKKDILVVDTKNVDTFKVMHYRMSGAEILETPKELKITNLPIIRALGYYEVINGTLKYRGVVRAAKDPQRVYNYSTSANVESTALKPKDKVLATKKMIKGHEPTWKSMNNSDSPVVTFTPDPEAPDGKPIPLSAGSAQPELLQQAQQAELDIQSTIGRRAPAQGESASDRSGRAILALQRQDDAVTFELLDNLARSWEQVATVVMEFIPHVYDTERQIQILGDDDQAEVVTINESVTDNQTDETFVRNDAGKRYEIKASVGPAFETKRSEMLNVLTVMSQDPELKPLVADLMANSMDFPFAPELTSRIRKMQLEQGIVEPNDEELEEQAEREATPEGQAAKQLEEAQRQLAEKMQVEGLRRAMLENENLAANVANLQAATAEKVGSAAKSNADVQETLTDVYAKQVDAIIGMIEAGIAPSPEQMQAANQSIQLLDATQQQEFQRRIQEAFQQAQQINTAV